MGWSVGWDSTWERDIGYGVPAICDDPTCNAEIDRGLAFVCGDEPYGGEDGCGLYFCLDHKARLCSRCAAKLTPWDPKPDTAEWVHWKLTDESWAQWRADNPEWVERHSPGVSIST